MKLYFKLGACSLVPHIVANEANINIDLVAVDLQTGLLKDGTVFKTISPKGYIPSLSTKEGKLLTEGPVIANYLASQNPDSSITPKMGSFDYFKMMEWQNFIGTEIHKQGFTALLQKAFGMEVAELSVQASLKSLTQNFALLNAQLAETSYLVGNQFTCADAYLYVVMLWADRLSLTAHKLPHLDRFFAEVKVRPSVVKAHALEEKLSA